MKTFAAVFVGGAAGLVLLKLLFGLLLPALGLLFGLLALVFKVALFAAVGYFVWKLLRGNGQEHAGAA